MRIVVSGGRDYATPSFARDFLDGFHEERPISVLIHGAARGLDTIAAEWAVDRGIPVMPFKITQEEWKLLKLAAGPIRNTRMIEKGKPDAGIIFDGNKGTKNMEEQLRRFGIPVFDARVNPRALATLKRVRHGY